MKGCTAMPWHTIPTQAVHAAVDVRHVPITPTKTQAAFIFSEATIVAVVASMGEGKSWSAIMGIQWHAQRCGVPLHVAIVRDTYQNIKGSVVPAFNDYFQVTGIGHRWRDEHHELLIDSTPPIHCHLFGIDDQNSLTRLQGPEYGLVWLEEVCPYVDSTRSNAGISEDVFNAALVRAARQKNTKARVQLTTNPPDEDHWFYRRIMSTPDGQFDPATPLITKKVFNIPYRENIHLKEESRQATIAAYRHDPVAYARFVEGKPATKYAGRPVTGRNFVEHLHVSEQPLEVQEGAIGFVFWDSWGNPAAMLGQQFPDGRLHFLDECMDEPDVRSLLRNRVQPLVLSPRWRSSTGMKCFAWRQGGDRTMQQPDQSNVTQSASRVVEDQFDPGDGSLVPFEPGPATWQHMKQVIVHALNWSVQGQPCVLIDGTRCKRLIAGLKGRWHYQTNKAGQVTSQLPSKDGASHICDAWANAVGVLMPWQAARGARPYGNQPGSRRRIERRRARSYTTAPLHVVGGTF